MPTSSGGRSCWAATSPDAAGGTFNLTNGDVFCWDTVWPVIADTFGIEVGEPRPMSFTRDLPDRDAEWAALVDRHGLAAAPTIEGFVGANSLVYADVVMADQPLAVAVRQQHDRRPPGRLRRLHRHRRHVRRPAPPDGGARHDPDSGADETFTPGAARTHCVTGSATGPRHRLDAARPRCADRAAMGRLLST